MERMSAVLAEQKRSCSPHSKDAIFAPQIPGNLKSELCNHPSIPCTEEFWAVLPAKTHRICTTDCKEQQSSQSLVIHNTMSLEYFVNLVSQHMGLFFFFFYKITDVLDLLTDNPTFIFRYLNRNSKYCIWSITLYQLHWLLYSRT